ncbi:type III secretion system chaperone family protein [Rugamonas aquatica]|uniref:Type III secretion system chaperone n=1 Tax=Rugamonas aquatica TaxID=2743357 RepID=A0A6A7N731_9BURK|nr:type III secretion system chaperone [Rugamonas aquatica]MQA40688.1 hypothetical protein [Rugamonas aquatica]
MNTLPIPTGLAELSTKIAVDLSEWATFGRVDLRVDAYPRVILRRGAAGRIEFELHLGALPRLGGEREQLLDRIMLRVTAGAPLRGAAPVLSADGEQLLLQALVRDEHGAALERALEDFLNEADYWTALLRGRV